jgi:RHS repeat-associated protein
VRSKKTANAGYFSYADSYTYTAGGAVSSMQLGNGKWESTQINSRLQPTQIALGTVQNGTDKLKLNYSYGTITNNGNVLSQTITVPTETINNQTFAAFAAVQTYTYDSLNRIKDAKEMIGATQQWKQTFTYDRYGNRRFDTTNNNTTTIPPGCAVAVCNPEVDPATNKLIGYQFDTAGNTKVDATNRQFIYDGENKQVEVKDQSGASIGKYFFDGDGKRVKKISATETTIFVYNASGQLVAEYSTQISQTPQVSYLTSDHLGSPRINTDANGNIIARHDFQPFGEEIQRPSYGADNVRQKFTGYERDNESELDFAQARYYSSKLGRFYSVDPENYGASEDDPQSWNGYGYGRNNPILYTDSEGLDYKICDRNGENCVTQSDEVVKAAQQKLRGLFQETGRDGDYDSGNILNDDGTPLGTYERVTIDPAYQLVYSTSDQIDKKGRTVRAVAAVGAAVGVCIGTAGAGCAFAKEGAEAIIELELGVRLDLSTLRRRSKKARKTKGNTTIYERRGGMNQANTDFNAMNPTQVKNIQTESGPGRTGKLPSGETVTVRPGSSGPDGAPTIEIRRNNRKTDEYRYR